MTLIVRMYSHVVFDDGTVGQFYYDATSTATHDNLTCIDPHEPYAEGATTLPGRWLRLGEEYYALTNLGHSLKQTINTVNANTITVNSISFGSGNINATAYTGRANTANNCDYLGGHEANYYMANNVVSPVFTTSVSVGAATPNTYISTTKVTSNAVQAGVCTIYSGSGVPAFSAQDGDIYIRQDGTTGTALYQLRGGNWTAFV